MHQLVAKVTEKVDNLAHDMQWLRKPDLIIKLAWNNWGNDAS